MMIASKNKRATPLKHKEKRAGRTGLKNFKGKDRCNMAEGGRRSVAPLTTYVIVKRFEPIQFLPTISLAAFLDH